MLLSALFLESFNKKERPYIDKFGIGYPALSLKGARFLLEFAKRAKRRQGLPTYNVTLSDHVFLVLRNKKSNQYFLSPETQL